MTVMATVKEMFPVTALKGVCPAVSLLSLVKPGAWCGGANE